MVQSKSLKAGAGCLTVGMLLFAYFKRQGKTPEALMMLLLGAVAAFALFWLPLERKKQEKEKRLLALKADYSQLITSLNLYMTAGLSLRSSWEQIVRDYEEGLKRGEKKKEVYEEMLITWREIKGGIFEDRAYGAFGRRCLLPEYLRLGGMLETYVLQGNKELLKQLEQEAISSMSQALQEAKRKGEKTGTKLLVPLLLLFALSLAMVMVPALISMQAGW